MPTRKIWLLQVISLKVKFSGTTFKNLDLITWGVSEAVLFVASSVMLSMIQTKTSLRESMSVREAINCSVLVG